MIGRTQAILAVVIAVAGFGGGWVVHGWKQGAEENIEHRAALKAMQDEIDRLKGFNDQTAEQEKAALASIRGLNAVIENLKNEISRLEMGACRLTPDADRVRERAYGEATATRPPRGATR